MRIWSLHPKYLDAKGLVALWRESLIAKKVLEGKTIGYTQHPQLVRFNNADNPLHYMNNYLLEIYNEAERRGYCFDLHKIDRTIGYHKLPVSNGQLEYEKQHLLLKLIVRDITKYQVLFALHEIETHPIFYIKEGKIENWEKTF